MRIVVSACLLGHNCKYNGGNNRSQAVLDMLKGHEVLPLCPEVMGGLPTPRTPAEIRDGKVRNAKGEDIDIFFRRGVEKAMEKLQGQTIDLAILQSRSPSCGVKQIYDGTFSKQLIYGRGLFAQALAEAGIPLLDAEDLLQK